jgi:hypothetical protein
MRWLPPKRSNRRQHTPVRWTNDPFAPTHEYPLRRAPKYLRVSIWPSFASIRSFHVRSSLGHSMVQRPSFAHYDAADFIANLPKQYSETFHWRLVASTVEAACHSDEARLVNSATEYIAPTLVLLPLIYVFHEPSTLI